jgi:hypothetical protein
MLSIQDRQALEKHSLLPDKSQKVMEIISNIKYKLLSNIFNELHSLLNES